MSDAPKQRVGRTIVLALRLVSRAGKWQLVVAIATSVVTALAVAGQLLVGRDLLNLLADNDRVSAGDLAPGLILLGALLLLGAISQAVGNEIRIPLGERVHRLALDEILDVATEIEYEAYEGTEFHDQLQRARQASGGQSTAVVFGVVTLISTLVVTLGVVAVLVAIAPVLLPVAVVGYVPIVFVNVRNTRARYRFERGLTELQRDRSYLEFVLTDRSYAKEVRSYGTSPALRRWHGEIWDERLARLRVLVRQRLLLSTGGSLVTTIALVGTLAIALILAGRGSITIGDAAAAVLGLQQLSTRLQSAGTALNGIHEGVAFLRDFESFRASLPMIRARRPTGVPPQQPGALVATGLRYEYPGGNGEVLRDVGFELRRGQIMAVVGANGSGKSTLAKLVCGLLEPTHGKISWDGVDVSTCDPDLVRSQVAPVFQDYANYLLTLRRVVALGDPSRLDDGAGVEAALRDVGLDGLASGLPDGIDTRLGKAFTGGQDLSGGQWQRVAIARALFRDAPIVVLDEPSASLDPRAESELFDLLHTLCHDRIVIFVSHRFGTVRSADVVLVMDEGAVVETGSHDELIADRGLYYELFRHQAARFGMPTDG